MPSQFLFDFHGSLFFGGFRTLPAKKPLETARDECRAVSSPLFFEGRLAAYALQHRARSAHTPLEGGVQRLENFLFFCLGPGVRF